MQKFTHLLFILISIITLPLAGQDSCDVEVSGILAYCNSFSGNNTIPGYFIGFRIKSENGDTLHVVDLNGNVPMNSGKRIDDINAEFEPDDVSIAPVMIAGGMDSLEFWYFGPFTDGDTFNIVLVDPSGQCDTIEVASGTFTCQDADPNACEHEVPLYYLDFSLSAWEIGGGGGGNENVDQIFLIMQRSRVATCCQTGNQRCFEFIIKLDEDDIGLLVDDVGNGSPGGQIYADSLNGFMCGTTVANTWPFIQDNGNAGDDPICLSGSAREWIVLSCKQGNNVTGVSFGTVGELNVLPEYTYADCAVNLEVLNASSATWSSVDDPGLDHLISLGTNNMNATFLYNEDVFGEITSCEGDTFTYFISGVTDNECIPSDSVLHDTTFVVVYPPFSVTIDSICLASGDSILLEASINSPLACNYQIQWSTGDTSLSIIVPNESGTYSITVRRPELEGFVRDCSPAFDAIDITPPSIHCTSFPGIQVQCPVPLPPADLEAVEVSGCGISPLVYVAEENNGGAGCLSDPLIISRHYIVDFDGDTLSTPFDKDTCTQTFTFIDNIPPVMICPPNVTIGCSDSTLPVATGGNASAVDNCSEVVDIFYMDQVLQGICPQEKIITRTWTATDACGNQSSCIQQIRIEDNLSPQINCPPDVTVDCSSGKDPMITGEATATDICDPSPSITYSDVVSGNCGTINRTWRSTDACGNESTCIQVITVVDNELPQINCPADITVGCTDDTMPEVTGFALASDQCDLSLAISYTDSTVAGLCAQQSYIYRKWLATDECINTAICTQLITVKDTIPPAIICPPDVTLTCSHNTQPAATGIASATDNCDLLPELTFSDSILQGSCPQEISIQRIWQATDDCGNSTSCVQLIHLVDSLAPVLNCPPDLTLSCLDDTTPVATGIASAIDNCDASPGISFIDTILNGDCPYTYTISRQWFVTDACGNGGQCIQLIQITDLVPPQIICPANITVDHLAITLPANTGTATASDNCDPTPAVDFIDSLSAPCAPVTKIFRKWMATDTCGNSSICIQEITVADHGEICGSVQDDFGDPVVNVQIDLFRDVNNNETIDSGEPLVGTVMTDSAGNYCFEDVSPCAYVLREIQPANYESLSDYDLTPDPDGDDSVDGPDDEIPVIVVAGEIDADNVFTDISCNLELPVIPSDTICDGGLVIFDIPDPVLGLTYNWDFGMGSFPGTAQGPGPHEVTFDISVTDQVIVNPIFLTVSKSGCTDQVGHVSSVVINGYPNASIQAPTTLLCYFTERTFKPVADENSGAVYQWSFGNNAVPLTATGYGPHDVFYTVAGPKIVKLIVYPNDPGASCIDSSTISFNVLNCPANITGTVKNTAGVGIQGVNLRLYTDHDTNGLADNTTIIRSVFTNSMGIYSMASLTPGNYVIVQVQPTTWSTVDDYDSSDDLDIVPNIDSLDNLIPVTLKPSEIDADNIFIEAANPGDISGAVFSDPNNNENPDTGEGIVGVVIELFADDNIDGHADSTIPIDTAVTGLSGGYTFTNLQPGNYVLVEQQPAGYFSVKDFDPSNDQDSVANTNMMNDTLPVTLLNQEHDLHNYFINEFECSLLVTNMNDSNLGSLRFMISCAQEGDTIRFHANLAGEIINLTSDRIDIHKSLVLESSLQPRITVKSTVPGLFTVDAGKTFELINMELVSGVSGLPGAAFNNFGIIKLHDVTIHRNPLLPETEVLIFNQPASELFLRGNCRLMMHYD